MKPLFVAALEIQEFLRRSGDDFCFIGGIALQRWGEPRFTRDVDLTLMCQLGSEVSAVDRVLSGFRPRIDGARDFALKSRVILVESSARIPIDVALGALAFAGRLHDWADIESVLMRQVRSLDWTLLLGELKPLLELRESPENLDQLLKIRSRIEQADRA